MKDRNVEFPNRYLMVPVDGSSPLVDESGALVDLIPAPGTIHEAGTPWNKATWLTDETAMQIWPDAETRPADPTVDEALSKLRIDTKIFPSTAADLGVSDEPTVDRALSVLNTQQKNIPGEIFRVGDIKHTVRTDLGSNWLLCNGAVLPKSALSALIPLDVTKGWTGYTSSRPLVAPNEFFLYDNNRLYVFNRNGNVVYLRSTEDIVSGFTSPVTLSGIGSSDMNIQYISNVMKVGNYFVITFKESNAGSRYGMAYATNINGPYTTVYNDKYPVAPDFIGFTGSMYYYFVRHTKEDSESSSDYSGDETMRFYYATTLAGIFDTNCNYKDVFDAYGGAGYYGSEFADVNFVANSNYIAFSTTEISYTNSSGSRYKASWLRLIDLRTPSNIRVVSSIRKNNTFDSSSKCSVFIVNNKFYGTTKVNESSSDDTTYQFYELTETTATLLKSTSTFRYVRYAEVYSGKLYLFTPTEVAILPASAVNTFYNQSITWVNRGTSGDLLSPGSGMIFAWGVFILQYTNTSYSGRPVYLCQAHLPTISLGDGVYSYIRSD